MENAFSRVCNMEIWTFGNYIKFIFDYQMDEPNGEPQPFIWRSLANLVATSMITIIMYIYI